MRVLRRVLGVLIVGLSFYCAGIAGAEELKISTRVGDRFPDRTLPLIDGGESSLAKFRGKKTVLLHFASW